MTGLILEIKGVEKAVALEFYVERDRKVRMERDEMTALRKGNNIVHYAFIDTNKTGRGNLMCRVEFVDKEQEWERPVVVSGFTGYSIPCMGSGKTIACGTYKVEFNKVEDIPDNDMPFFCGVIKRGIGNFGELSVEEITELERTKETGVLEYHISPGETIVVAVPHDFGLKVYKDNGMGGKVEFSQQVAGENGKKLEIDGVDYMLYGEFFTVGGNFNIYIE